VKVYAPEGYILNCNFLVTVGDRHIIGHCLSTPIFEVLAKVLPDRFMADSTHPLAKQRT
jgi:hypothetical protein